MKKYIANIITALRILCSILLLLFSLDSLLFWVFYLLGGFSDMIDGFVARKMGSESKFGSMLDTLADFFFFFVLLVKLWPIVCLPEWLWAWMAVIAAAKLVNAILTVIFMRSVTMLHTLLNKITGVLLFCWPLSISFF